MTPTPPADRAAAPPTGAPVTPATPPAAPSAEEFNALKAQLDGLKGQVTEQTRAAQYWHERATKEPPAAAPARPAEEEPEVDVLDLAAKGGKAFSQYLSQWASKNGFVKGADMQGAIDAKAAQLSKEAELLKQYPDLSKKDSEFFQATAQHFGTFKKAGVPEHMAMEMAAEKAELELIRAGKFKTPRERDDDAKAQREQDRLARVRAQGGERSQRGAEPEEGDDELTDDQLGIVRKMLVGQPGKDGKAMDEAAAIAAYKARAQKGVAMRRR